MSLIATSEGDLKQMNEGAYDLNTQNVIFFCIFWELIQATRKMEPASLVDEKVLLWNPASLFHQIFLTAPK